MNVLEIKIEEFFLISPIYLYRVEHRERRVSNDTSFKNKNKNKIIIQKKGKNKG